MPRASDLIDNKCEAPVICILQMRLTMMIHFELLMFGLKSNAHLSNVFVSSVAGLQREYLFIEPFGRTVNRSAAGVTHAHLYANDARQFPQNPSRC